MMRYTFAAPDEQATDRLGAALAEALEPGSIVALNGPLGAGKTRLVQALAAALGIPRREVLSPTFVLIHEYEGRCPVFHFDAYRLADDDQFLELGPEEYFQRGGLVLIEWAERVARCLPREHLEIRIAVTGASTREFELVAHGEAYEAALERVRALAG